MQAGARPRGIPEIFPSGSFHPLQHGQIDNLSGAHELRDRGERLDRLAWPTRGTDSVTCTSGAPHFPQKRNPTGF